MKDAGKEGKEMVVFKNGRQITAPKWNNLVSVLSFRAGTRVLVHVCH